jgi:hypothetical protein
MLVTYGKNVNNLVKNSGTFGFEYAAIHQGAVCGYI